MAKMAIKRGEQKTGNFLTSSSSGKSQTKEKLRVENKNNENLEIKLIENFVSLQKVMVNLSGKFDELSKNISKLLELFELSATALAKKDINFTKPMDEEKIMGKLNNILEQNKIIARGMALMSEGREQELPPAPIHQPQKSQAPSPVIKGEYQKSPFKGF